MTEDSLKWALYCFKHHAMSKTSDQLKEECNAINMGEARLVDYGNGGWGGEHCKIIYAQDEMGYKKEREA